MHHFAQVVVEKGWQGVTYVMLDRLEACGVSYASAVEVSTNYNCKNLPPWVVDLVSLFSNFLLFLTE